MTDHLHAWIDLPADSIIEVKRVAVGHRGVQSMFEIVAICFDGSCKAGRTRDGVVFENIHAGSVIESEGGVTTFTGKLGIKKEKR